MAFLLLPRAWQRSKNAKREKTVKKSLRYQRNIVFSKRNCYLEKALKPISTEAALASPGNGGRLYGDYGNSW